MCSRTGIKEKSDTDSSTMAIAALSVNSARIDFIDMVQYSGTDKMIG